MATISGGSRRYVEALTAPFADRIRTGSRCARSRRHQGEDGIGRADEPDPRARDLRPGDRRRPQRQALRLLSDASPAEHEILGAIGYSPTSRRCTRTTVPPRNRRAGPAGTITSGWRARRASGGPR
jgi:predicted NAD/FAD-binding protein